MTIFAQDNLRSKVYKCTHAPVPRVFQNCSGISRHTIPDKALVPIVKILYRVRYNDPYHGPLLSSHKSFTRRLYLDLLLRMEAVNYSSRVPDVRGVTFIRASS